jgi:hypothetical protein
MDERRSLHGHELVATLALALACFDAYQHNGSNLHLHLASVERDKREGTDWVLFLNLADGDEVILSEEEISDLLRRVEDRSRRERRALPPDAVDALRLDGTGGSIAWKIKKNQAKRKEKGDASFWPFGVRIEMFDEASIVVLMDEHRSPKKLGPGHFDSLIERAAAGAVRLSPQAICPIHGRKCPLVMELRSLARILINRWFPEGDPARGYRNWKALF